jgi:hypothetical protein
MPAGQIDRQTDSERGADAALTTVPSALTLKGNHFETLKVAALTRIFTAGPLLQLLPLG